MEVWRGIAEGLNAAIVNPAIILGVTFIRNSRKLEYWLSKTYESSTTK